MLTVNVSNGISLSAGLSSKDLGRELIMIMANEMGFEYTKQNHDVNCISLN